MRKACVVVCTNNSAGNNFIDYISDIVVHVEKKPKTRRAFSHNAFLRCVFVSIISIFICRFKCQASMLAIVMTKMAV